MGNLRSQTRWLLKSMVQPGTSRHRAKRDGTTATVITSYRTYHAYIEALAKYADWLQGQGIRRWDRVTPTLARTYLEHLSDQGKSSWTIAQTHSGMAKLQNAMEQKGWTFPGVVPPPEYALPTRHLAWRVKGGGYSLAQIPAILAAAAPQYRPALEAQWQLGLRVAEVTMPVQAVDWAQGVIVVKGKGGKIRTVPIPASYRATLQAQCVGKADTDKLFGGSPRSLQRQMVAVSAKLGIQAHGTHGLRYAYAQRRYQELLSEGLADVDARRQVSRELGHERLSITSLYLQS